MKYKKHLLLSAGLGFLASLQAQEAVTAAGGSAKSGNLTVSWSIGEVMTETFVTPTFTLTQGVQQPQVKVEQVTSSPELSVYKITAYPNPASDAVIVSVAEVAEHPLTLRVFDANGKLLQVKQITDSETRISIADFAAGMYMLQITDKKRKVQTFKIIKQ